MALASCRSVDYHGAGQERVDLAELIESSWVRTNTGLVRPHLAYLKIAHHLC